MKVVIAGNGVAGVSVAKELRSIEPDSKRLGILVLSREHYGYYSRIRLPEIFGGKAGPGETLALYKPSWYRERDIEESLGREICGIDRARKCLVASSGPDVPYDRLVLALGSDAVRPDLPGSCLPGVFTVREYDDAARVMRSVERDRSSAAVVGGGLLGLEAARHLKDAGVGRVTVIEGGPRLLPRQLDEDGAGVIGEAFRDMGIDIVTNARVEGFGGNEWADSVILRGGLPVPAGTVILSMGVRPRTGIARAAGLVTAKGIVVDGNLRSSDPDIHAAGDCAEFNGASWGIIPAAMEMAAPCARAILGDESSPYTGTIPSNTLKVAGIELFSAGAVDPPDIGNCERLGFGPESGRYERYILRDGVLEGAIVIGSRLKARVIGRLMGSRVDRRMLSLE